MKPLLIFDVNETLLRVDALQPEFSRVFGDPHVLKEWFNALVLYSQTATLIGSYEDFSTLAEQPLRWWLRQKMSQSTTKTNEEFCKECFRCPPILRCPRLLRNCMQRDTVWRLSPIPITKQLNHSWRTLASAITSNAF